VVLAIGISWFAHVPEILARLPAEHVSHSYAHRDGSGFKGREVAVIGAGASAVDLAWLLHEQGASVRIVSRADTIEFNKVPDAYEESLIGRLHRPASGIGRGWRSYFCAQAPLLFYRLPESLRLRAIESHMHPAGGWFMREKVEEVFGCPVYNRYGSREVGDIAGECKYHQGLHVLPWGSYVEIVDEAGNLVEPGVEGRILVTCLTNYAMPLIRYDIGDRGALAGEFKCPCGRDGQMFARLAFPGSVLGGWHEVTSDHFEVFTVVCQVLLCHRVRAPIPALLRYSRVITDAI